MQSRIRGIKSHSHWRSGFFDGDGSMFVKVGKSYPAPVLAIGLASSPESLETLSQFQILYGGNIRVSSHPDIRHAKNRIVSTWSASGPAIFPALEDLKCGLNIKRPQADLLLAHRHLFPGRPGIRISDTMKRARTDLQQAVRRVRAEALSTTTVEEYSDRFLTLCVSEDQACAYAAGFCDADGCYICCATGTRRTHVYKVFIAQKNRQFLEAFKEVILSGRGSNVYTSPTSGMSSLTICSASDVQDFCSRVMPFSIAKARQLDVILSEPPGSRSKDLLASMHGNQGPKTRELKNDSRAA